VRALVIGAAVHTAVACRQREHSVRESRFGETDADHQPRATDLATAVGREFLSFFFFFFLNFFFFLFF
jgi:hypothetical protein